MIIWFYSCVLILYLPTIYGTEWPIMCWCAVKKLLTHSLCRRPHVSFIQRRRWEEENVREDANIRNLACRAIVLRRAKLGGFRSAVIAPAPMIAASLNSITDANQYHSCQRPTTRPRRRHGRTRIEQIMSIFHFNWRSVLTTTFNGVAKIRTVSNFLRPDSALCLKKRPTFDLL